MGFEYLFHHVLLELLHGVGKLPAVTVNFDVGNSGVVRGIYSYDPTKESIIIRVNALKVLWL